MKKQILFLFLISLLALCGYGQRSYNYSRRYTSTMQHVSNKVAMKKALEKKRNKTAKDSVRRETILLADSIKKKTNR